MTQQTTPSITNAREYVDTIGKIPGGSILRTADNRLMVVERSNGFVVSGMEQGKTSFDAWMAVDLRNSAAEIVSVMTIVDDTAPEAAPVAPKASKVAKLSAPMIAALKETAIPGRQGRCYDASTGTMKALVARGLFVWADKSGTFEDIADITAAGIAVRDSLGKPTTPALTVEVKPAAQPVPVKATAITYRKLGGLFHHAITCKTPTHETYIEDGMVYTHIGKCVCGGTMEAEFVDPYPVSAKPTTSPALVETGEHVIPVTPMALPTIFVVAGNKHLRVTTHHAGNGAIFTVETLESFSGTWDAEPHGYANREQLGNAIARITRACQPPAETAPAPDNFTAEKLANAKARMEAAELDWQALHAQMHANRATGKYRRHAVQLSKDSERLHDLDKRRQMLATTYTQMAGFITPEPTPPAPTQDVTPAAPAHKLSKPLIEALRVLSHVPHDYTIRAHIWNRATEERPADNWYRISRRVAEGLVSMGYAKRPNHSAIEITPEGRTALQATFKSSAVNSKS